MSYTQHIPSNDSGFFVQKTVILVIFISSILVLNAKFMKTDNDEIENFTLKLRNKGKSDSHKTPFSLPTVPNTIIYNRVPKCGSTTMTKALEILEKKNSRKNPAKTLNFKIKNYVIPREKHYFRNNTPDYKDFKKMLEHDSTENLLYIRHMYFQPESDVKYINIIRHPVEHFISWYYWERKHSSGEWMHIVEKGTSRLTIDECIDSGEYETCKNPGEYTEYLSYLCGQDLFCRDGISRKSLEKAEQNVEENYLVVGVLEMIEESLAVFEDRVGSWFSGIGEAYHEIEKTKGTKVMSSDKIEPSEKAKAYLTGKMGLEIELYEFVVRRLQQQYEMIGGE